MNLPYISGAVEEVEVRVMLSVGVVENTACIIYLCGLNMVGAVGFC